MGDPGTTQLLASMPASQLILVIVWAFTWPFALVYPRWLTLFLPPFPLLPLLSTKQKPATGPSVLRSRSHHWLPTSQVPVLYETEFWASTYLVCFGLRT